MTDNLPAVRVENLGNVLETLEDAFFDIPFENSDYQNQAFVVAAQQTPGRAYRSIGLRMFSKIHAVKEYMFSQEKNKIDIEEKQAQIADPDTNRFDRRRLELEIAKLEDGVKWGQKLLNDALRELNCLHAEFAKLPKYDRAQFEAEEPLHFEAKLARALSHQGASESLLNMKVDLPQWNDRAALAVSRIAVTHKG